jgi:hypothetical protein
MRNQSHSKDKGTSRIILSIALFIYIRMSLTTNIDNLLCRKTRALATLV